MSILRYLAAPPIRFLHRLGTFGLTRTSAFRMLLFHGIEDHEHDAFDRLVAYIVREHGVISPTEAVAESADQDVVRPSWCLPCLFTFDDGFGSNFEVAASILDRYGVKALFFVCPGLTDLEGDMQRQAVARQLFQGRIDAEDLPSGTRLMNWDELCNLKSQGHVIGCHGMRHQRLTEITKDELVEEVEAAGDLLDTRLAQKTDWYAYAFGDIGSIDRLAMEAISRRFRYCRSGVRGANGRQTNRMAFCADSLSPGAPLSYQKLLIEGAVDILYGRRRRALEAFAVKAAIT